MSVAEGADGLCFPVTSRDQAGGAVRSTQVTGKQVLAAAVRSVDAVAADRISNEERWRFRYHHHFVTSVELSAKSPAAALKVANAGLDYMYDHFEFVREGVALPLREALDRFDGSFATGFVQGRKPKPDGFELEVPYRGEVLTGDALEVQLDRWVRDGVVELSCAAAIGKVARSSWLDLSGRYFVLLGAGAAMGPLSLLLSLGANVIAVDLDAPALWERLIAAARDSCGTLTFPLAPGAEQSELSSDQLCAAAGCNLFTQTPEVRNWLLAVHPGQQLCVGGYAYIPGEQFPRVALAMDIIIKALSEQRQSAVAFLCTPTDCHLVPPAAHAAAEENARRAPAWQRLVSTLSGGRLCKPNARAPLATSAGERLYVCDAFVVAQGPNYALAKRMQHWRAMVAREGGCVVSSNVAPSTKTASVTQNKNFALAYEMLPAFRPYEVPGPETSNAVMGALLIHDLNAPDHAGRPGTRLANPQQIFSDGAFHGGAWRCGYAFDSIGAVAVVLYYLQRVLLRAYLVGYNAVQTFGWCTVALRVAAHLAVGATDAPWASFGEPLLFYQNLALLEVLHATLGAVRAPVVTTAAQIASRVAVVNVASAVVDVHTAWPLFVVGLAWSATEVVRYSWYMANLLTKPATAHTWLRYSSFIVLYPAGVAGELLLYHAALPGLAQLSWMGVPLSSIVRWVVFPAYVPGLPMLYLHMLQQRAKALGRTRVGASKHEKGV